MALFQRTDFAAKRAEKSQERSKVIKEKHPKLKTLDELRQDRRAYWNGFDIQLLKDFVTRAENRYLLVGEELKESLNGPLSSIDLGTRPDNLHLILT